ncbi:MAG: dicarboxylate/amino acid:cation symporter [Alistipes sp.]|nr:dicarboxylate/amino acid:cation symporter [Alistipes sp.]
MKKFSLSKLGLIPRIVLAIALGIGTGMIAPEWIARSFATFNEIFGQFLGFIVPLLIVGLVAPGIADLGRGAGRLLAITALLAYIFTLISGGAAYTVGTNLFPALMGDSSSVIEEATTTLSPWFTVKIPPVFDVMTALVVAFLLGLGTAVTNSQNIKGILSDFGKIIEKVIQSIIIPLLPIYIFGIFMKMTITGEVTGILSIFVKVIGVLLVLNLCILVFQYTVAGIVGRKNPFKMLWTMLPAYLTAVGTQSSAATIPVTLERAKMLGVRPSIASFTIPLCATIHLSGSMANITSFAIAFMIFKGMPIESGMFVEFICLLGVTMIAAPGVPGGAVMAALAVLSSALGFNEEMLGLMIAAYTAIDSMGTATNVTGDGAVTVIVDRIDQLFNKNREE